jgi:hypothetical protein
MRYSPFGTVRGIRALTLVSPKSVRRIQAGGVNRTRVEMDAGVVHLATLLEYLEPDVAGPIPVDDAAGCSGHVHEELTTVSALWEQDRSGILPVPGGLVCLTP